MKKRNKIITMILSMSMVLTMVIGSLTIVNAAWNQTAADAFANGVAEYTSDGNTYTLKQNLNLNGTSIYLAQDEEITIDLNGFTIENTEDVIGSPSATGIKLTIMDSSNNQTGKIISGEGIPIKLTGRNNNITIKGGSIISYASSSLYIGQLIDGTLTIEDGIFYGCISGQPYYQDRGVYVYGGYFEPNTANNGNSFYFGNMSYDKTIKSIFSNDSYVSLNGADPIPVSSASEFDGTKYAGTVQVFASGPTANTTKDTTVKALVNKQITPPDVNVPTYTTTIPDTIDLGTLNISEEDNYKSVPFDITVSEATDFGNGEVVVSIKADPDLNLTSGNNKLPYTIHNAATEGESILSGQTLFTFNGNYTKTGCIQVNEKGIPAAGSYTGTLTFNIAFQSSGTN